MRSLLRDGGPSPLALVVSTLGRVDALRRLFETAGPQLTVDDTIVVVAQGNVEEVAAATEAARASTAATIVLTTSLRGASVGRNAGVAALQRIDDPLLLFPNDTTWFPPGSLSLLRESMASAPAGGAIVMTSDGPRFRLPPVGTPLDRRSVWSVIEMGLIIRRSLFDAVGGFDSSIGTGAATPWQAGEGTDLLLRALADNPALRNDFRWIHTPGAVVGGIAETSHLSRAERRWKIRAYGRGIAHVQRRHRYPVHVRWGFVAAGALVGLRRAGDYRITDGLPAIVGRWEGATGHVTARAVHRPAVER